MRREREPQRDGSDQAAGLRGDAPEGGYKVPRYACRLVFWLILSSKVKIQTFEIALILILDAIALRCAMRARCEIRARLCQEHLRLNHIPY